MCVRTQTCEYVWTVRKIYMRVCCLSVCMFFLRCDSAEEEMALVVDGGRWQEEEEEEEGGKRKQEP